MSLSDAIGFQQGYARVRAAIEAGAPLVLWTDLLDLATATSTDNPLRVLGDDEQFKAAGRFFLPTGGRWDIDVDGTISVTPVFKAGTNVAQDNIAAAGSAISTVGNINGIAAPLQTTIAVPSISVRADITNGLFLSVTTKATLTTATKMMGRAAITGVLL